MPVPEQQMPFMEEAGFGHAIQLQDFAFDAPLLRAARAELVPEPAEETGQGAPAGEAPQAVESLSRLNREYHVAGALREKVLLPRRCSFLMPVPEQLMSFMEEAGFGQAIQLRDFTFDAPLVSAFVERWRPETHTLLSSTSGTNSSLDSSPELASISIGTSSAEQLMCEHGITPFELDEPPATSGMLCISVSSSITSQVTYLRCRSNRARTCSTLST
ncbi:hypothetical protein PIB30_024983 [Stylosanthes scabra]|uniref:Uncharacterized protein n=1 Tax=Stylosanthes scabra TaxID=79078 RepID=A0ABU6Y8Q2_9FABA|nr:hypothetical protein [Stylosanthes scabra]